MIHPSTVLYKILSAGSLCANFCGFYLIYDGIQSFRYANQSNNPAQIRTSANLIKAVGLTEAALGGMLIFNAATTANHVFSGEALDNTEAMINGMALMVGGLKVMASL